MITLAASSIANKERVWMEGFAIIVHLQVLLNHARHGLAKVVALFGCVDVKGHVELGDALGGVLEEDALVFFLF